MRPVLVRWVVWGGVLGLWVAPGVVAQGPAQSSSQGQDRPWRGSYEQSQPDLLPRPDPSLLTTQQLLREMSSLRAIIETRLDAMDKALDLLQKIADRVPNDIDVRVGQLQSLHAEKFRSIENQFASSKTALDSALQSSEKSNAEKNALQALAISKAETNVAEQLKGISGAIQNVERILSDKVQGLKERLDRQEGAGVGIGASWGVLVGVIGMLGVAVAIAVAFANRPHRVPPP